MDEKTIEILQNAKTARMKFATQIQEAARIAGQIDALKTLSAKEVSEQLPILKAQWVSLCELSASVYVAAQFDFVEQASAISIANSKEIAERQKLQDMIVGM